MASSPGTSLFRSDHLHAERAEIQEEAGVTRANVPEYDSCASVWICRTSICRC